MTVGNPRKPCFLVPVTDIGFLKQEIKSEFIAKKRMERNEAECYPIQMDYLPDIFHQKAVRELNETPERWRVEVKKLKELLSDNKITTAIVFEEDFLRLFLRHTKYNSSKAFHYLLNFISFRRNYGSLFASIPDENFATNPSTKMFSILPYRSPDGCAIILSEIEFCSWSL
ncbi:unnamed protein product [Larinioides sclopetarius]|uniref:Uncharacterized protein n=1 Tax=Larinioides sclopetarius TaxID=280406 RepID=A0AAV2BQF4_9ARAC